MEAVQEEAPYILRPKDGVLDLAHILRAVRAAEKVAFPNPAQETAIPLDEATVRDLEAEAGSSLALAQFTRAALSVTSQQPSFGDWLASHPEKITVKRRRKKESLSAESAQLRFF